MLIYSTYVQCSRLRGLHISVLGLTPVSPSVLLCSSYQLMLWCWLSDTTKRPTMREVASTVHRYLGEGWEAEFGASGSGGRASTEASSASLASAGEFPNGAFHETSKHEDPAMSPSSLKTVEVTRKRAGKGWGKEADGKGVRKGGEEGDTYINVVSRKTEAEEEDEEYFVRSSAWTDGEPDEEYVISVEDFTGNRDSTLGCQVERGEAREDKHEPDNPIYSNTSMLSLHSLHSESNHSNAAKAAQPPAKSHAHTPHPTRSAEGGRLSPRPHKAPHKSPANTHRPQ